MRMPDLPIFEIERPLLETLVKNKRLVLTAPTGSGKSTQVPQMLLDGGLLGGGQVVVLQPRRLPTRMLAAWVAKARQVALGAEVGYQMRLNSAVSPATRICYVTEGVLLRRMLKDPNLAGVNAIVFDEFHERHLYGDITLARALDIQESARPDLIIIVMSATLDVAAVRKYLDPCDVLSVEGRAFPVTIEYLRNRPSDTPIWQLAVHELQRLVRAHAEGDALVFMPGSFEITRTVQAARDALGAEFLVFPLHGELPNIDQDKAVARYDRRKIVVATNVAETSLTIDGVRLVIDSGLARIPRFDPYRGINTLLVEKIGRAAADQRAGRAGRTAPGHCLRLWTAHDHHTRALQEVPEVKRLDLAEVILTLKAGAVSDAKRFRWLEAPEPRTLERAEVLLTDLGAIDDKTGVITGLGYRMLAFPAHPRYARMLLAAHDYGCVRQVALIAALTQGRGLMMRRQRERAGEILEDPMGEETESDLFLLMRAWRDADRYGYQVDRCRRIGVNAQAARQVGSLYEQFLNIAAAEGLDITDKPVADEAVQRCVLLGFSDQVSQRLDKASGRCQLVHGRRGTLARESVVQNAPLFVVCEAREIQNGGGGRRTLNVVLDLATAIKEEWLRELFPGDFNETHVVVYHPSLRRVVAREERRFRDLVLEERNSECVPADDAARILARNVIEGCCRLSDWNKAVEPWLLRVNLLRAWMPELGLPAIGAEARTAILELICRGAFSCDEIAKRPALSLAKSWLTRPHQLSVDKHAPERLQLPRGRSVKIDYCADAAPTIAARIQDLYGVQEGLWIADHRVRVRIQVLAPSNRPVQVTENLAVFWRETYPKLKQELQRRYPKHEWR